MEPEEKNQLHCTGVLSSGTYNESTIIPIRLLSQETKI